MFDIGFPELLLVSVVMLLVFGPERLPEVLRTVGRFVGGARRSFESLRNELEREVGADEIRRELHNARIMEEAKKLDSMVRAGRDEVEEILGERYAALKEEGAVEEDGARATSGSEDPALAPTPDEGNAEGLATPPEPATETDAEPSSEDGPTRAAHSGEARRTP